MTLLNNLGMWAIFPPVFTKVYTVSNAPVHLYKINVRNPGNATVSLISCLFKINHMLICKPLRTYQNTQFQEQILKNFLERGHHPSPMPVGRGNPSPCKRETPPHAPSPPGRSRGLHGHLTSSPSLALNRDTALFICDSCKHKHQMKSIFIRPVSVAIAIMIINGVYSDCCL